MPKIPKHVEDRLVDQVKRFQPILLAAKSRDVNEADTVLILTDILADAFGYDKYTDLTSEMAIRGTYCDLALKLDGKIQVLIEAKAVGMGLKDSHVKQAVDYAANKGIEWVVLTNGVVWRIYKVTFTKPIDHELLCDFDFLALNPKDEQHLQLLFLLTKEGWAKSAVGDFHQQKQALNRFFVGATLLSEPILSVIRRELKRISPDVRIEVEQIRTVLTDEVLKREILEGEKFTEAQKTIGRAANKALRARKDEETSEVGPPSPDRPPDAPSSTSPPSAQSG